MRKLKFLHFADLHLDTPFTSLGASRKSAVRRQELKACLQRIVAAAADEKADLLLVCGDLYEHGYTGKATVNFIADEFRKIPGTKVVIIPGNHDPYTGNSFYRSFAWPDNVYILAGEQTYVVFEELRTCIFSQDCMESARKGYLNLLMLHGTLDLGFSKSAWNPFESRELDRLGMDYIAFGHFHSCLKGAGRNGNIYNPGSPEPMGFDETGEHGIFAGTLTEKDDGERSREIRYLQVNARKCIRLETDIGGCRTDEQALQRMIDDIRSSGSKDDLYEIHMKGFTEDGFQPDVSYISGRLSDEAFFTKVADESMPGYDFEAIAEEPGLKGLFVRKMLNRIDGMATEKDRQLARRAMIYGLQAIDGGL